MKKLQYIIALVTMLSPFLGTAQEGENLFKAKCSVCHMIDKNSTGPALKDVKAKWDEAGESELLYEWVRNPEGLIASGKSSMATAIKDFSASSMSNQDVTNEQIDAIFEYVDTYVKVDNPPPPGDSPEQVVTYVPNYEQNLNLFYMLLATIAALLIGILILTGSITRLIKSDYFKKKVGEQYQDNSGKGSGIIKTIALIVGFTGLMTNTSHALEFVAPGATDEQTPWLLVENIDIYVMIIINLILLGVLLYLRRMFKNFVSMTKEEEYIEAPESEIIKKVNNVLTDAVPIEEEHTILLHHEYDGIRELDNNLPPWWVWGFYATIVFSVVYIFNYHIFKTAPLQEEEYNIKMEQADKEVQAYLKKMAMNVDESNVTLMTEPSDLAAGKTLFDKNNCITCHGAKGGGDVGPNLTDKYWIYGYDIKDVFKTIKKGTPNGMPEHESKMNPVQLQQVSSYVLSFPETKGIDPQGDIIEE